MINTTALANFLAQRRMRFGKEEENKMYVEINGVRYYPYIVNLDLDGDPGQGTIRNWFILSKYEIGESPNIFDLLTNNNLYEGTNSGIGYFITIGASNEAKPFTLYYDEDHTENWVIENSENERFIIAQDDMEVESASIICLYNGKIIEF